MVFLKGLIPQPKERAFVGKIISFQTPSANAGYFCAVLPANEIT
jgi:hypothetical protein